MKIDFEQIIKTYGHVYPDDSVDTTVEEITDALKETLRQAIPIILKDAADHAETYEASLDYYKVDKSSITARKEVLIKQFNLK